MALKISIVIPNYNSGRQLDRAIQSLLAQDYPDVELILVDAGSTDESWETIEKHRAHFDVLIREPDGGQADGLNKGFRRAAGDIFAWLCADDELQPGALRHIADLFMAHPEIDIITGACQRIFSDGATYVVPPSPEPWENISIQNVIEQPSTFWRARVHRTVGELDNSYRLAFDWDLWNRIKNAGAHIATTDRILSKYYFTSTNKSGNSGRGHVNEAFRIVREYGPMWGGLAYIFRFLYFQFDLTGCYDRPPTCTLLRSHLFVWTLAALRAIIGKRLLYLYNWHFASCQERGLKWW